MPDEIAVVMFENLFALQLLDSEGQPCEPPEFLMDSSGDIEAALLFLDETTACAEVAIQREDSGDRYRVVRVVTPRS